MNEENAPEGVLELGIKATGRVVEGCLYADFGNGWSMQVLSKETVDDLEKNQNTSLNGQRMLIRVAFLDVPA